jgi:MFS transporter, ACS family, solute carrier family 17 (sodium-dependent inorganic phosphate cotransporter), other
VAWPFIKPEKVTSSQLLLAQQQAEAEAAAAAARGESPEPGTPGSKKKLHVPWGAFLSSPPVWAVTVAHFCFNWGYYTLLAWLPSYFELALGLNVEKSSIFTLIPYVAMTAMMPLVGPVADNLVDRGLPLTWVRER